MIAHLYHSQLQPSHHKIIDFTPISEESELMNADRLPTVFNNNDRGARPVLLRNDVR